MRYLNIKNVVDIQPHELVAIAPKISRLEILNIAGLFLTTDEGIIIFFST